MTRNEASYTFTMGHIISLFNLLEIKFVMAPHLEAYFLVFFWKFVSGSLNESQLVSNLNYKMQPRHLDSLVGHTCWMFYFPVYNGVLFSLFFFLFPLSTLWWWVVYHQLQPFSYKVRVISLASVKVLSMNLTLVLRG